MLTSFYTSKMVRRYQTSTKHDYVHSGCELRYFLISG